jgi:hypothetical protein
VRWLTSPRDSWPSSTGLSPAEAEAALALAEEQLDRTARLASRDDVTKALFVLASTYGVDMPDEHGLIMYAAVLDEIPKPVLWEGMKTLGKTHKWPRLPYPSEILDACALPASELRFWQERVKRARALAARSV